MFNAQLENEIKNLINENPKGWCALITKNKKYKHLLNYIITQTPLLSDSKYKFVARTYWTLHHIQSWNDKLVSCRECGKPISDNPRFRLKGYGEFCSMSCTNKNKDRRKQAMETSLKKFGKGNGNNRRKAKNTCMKKYGSEFYMGTEEFKNKVQETVKIRYGVNHVMEVPEFIERMAQTKMERYGNPYYVNLTKLHDTLHKRTKERWDEIKEKTKKTCLERYGVEWPALSKTAKIKSRKTCLERFGVEYAIQSPDVMAHSRIRYVYNGLNFDSKPELAVYIYCKDHSINFQYKPKISFEFKCHGIKHYYRPDFIIEEKIVEVKGEQFFDEKGKMICPYTKKLDDETREKVNDLYEAKHQCMIQNGVMILTSKDYLKYLKYVKEKYGKNFLTNLKKKV